MANVAPYMADRDRDEESGRFTGEYSVDEFLDAIRELGGTAGTTKIAEEVGCDRRTAYVRLKELQNDGVVKGQKIGNSLAWSVQE